MKGLGQRQIWWADLDTVRPVVILTRSSVADRLTRVLVAPITSTVRGIATEVPLGRAEGVRPGSVANLDNVQLLHVDRLLERAGLIDDTRWPEFCAATRKVIAC